MLEKQEIEWTIFSRATAPLVPRLRSMRLSTLGQHGAIPRWQIAAKHARMSRLQEEKLKVRSAECK